jgi:hypothetical protein
MIGRKAFKPVGETGNSDTDEHSPVKAVEYDVSSVLPSAHREPSRFAYFSLEG